jgi:1,4-alpha-glucan branching enzyme
VLPISHDEVVHGKGSLLRKMPGDRWQQLANLRTYLAYMWAHPGKQLIFMGTEFAQEAEWADGRSLDWWLLDHAAHYRVHNLVKELNHVYQANPSLWALDADPAGFEWLDANDNAGNTYSYLRFGTRDRQGPVLAVAVNFGGLARERLRLGVPRGGEWRVVLDTSGYDELGTPSQAGVVLTAQEQPAHNQPYSVEVRVAPLSTVYLAPVDHD